MCNIPLSSFLPKSICFYILSGSVMSPNIQGVALYRRYLMGHSSVNLPCLGHSGAPRVTCVGCVHPPVVTGL